MAGVELGDLAEISDTYTGEAAPGSLLDVAEPQVCQELDIGFRLRFDPAKKKLLFELYRPLLDRNARYAPQYGNLTDLTYTESTADYKNVVIVVGGDATVTVGAESTAGIARRELVVDAAQPHQKQQPDPERLPRKPESPRHAGAGQAHSA